MKKIFISILKNCVWCVKTKKKIHIVSNLGSDDIRAHDTPKINSWRPLSADLPPLRSIYDEPSTASERIVGAGYRYLPVHRETYGYSPRPIYSHHYGRPSKYKWHHRFVSSPFFRSISHSFILFCIHIAILITTQNTFILVVHHKKKHEMHQLIACVCAWLHLIHYLFHSKQSFELTQLPGFIVIYFVTLFTNYIALRS